MSQHSDFAANHNKPDSGQQQREQQPAEVETLWVELGERRYPIYISTSDALPDGLNRMLVENRHNTGTNTALVIDEVFANLQKAPLPVSAPKLDLAVNGETAKSMEKLGTIYDQLASLRVARDGALFAIGGGVTGDLAGFAAATYLRGIDFYQIPTTLLAMVDSSVGGKTGINIGAGKNLVGAFWQPKAVFISTNYLKTLPPREFSAGMAEVIKYGMLYDAELFKELEQHVADGRPLTWDHPALPKVIRRCCEIKAAIVGDDERETSKEGGRALLNLGHTFAHAIENAAGYGTYLHGEAVGIGLVMAARLSEALTQRGETGYHFSAKDVERVTALVEAYHLPTALNQPLGAPAGTTNTSAPTPAVTPPPLSLAKLQQAMGRDKKVEAGTIRFVAMHRIGTAVKTHGVDASLIDPLWHTFGVTS